MRWFVISAVAVQLGFLFVPLCAELGVGSRQLAIHLHSGDAHRIRAVQVKAVSRIDSETDVREHVLGYSPTSESRLWSAWQQPFEDRPLLLDVTTSSRVT